MDLVLFVFTNCPNWKAHKSITWDYYNYIYPGEMRMNRSSTTRVMKIDIKWLKVTFCIKEKKWALCGYRLSGEEEDNAEFSMINPNLLDLDLEFSDNMSNAPVLPTIIDTLLLPNEQFYVICSQLNEVQQHLFNFKLQHALCCKLAEKIMSCHPNLFKYF